MEHDTMDHVVVDVEIQRTIEETPGGWDSTHLLGVAVACVWEYRTQRMRVYGPDDIPALRDRLLAADRISGYNIFNFDFPVIFGCSKVDWLVGSGIAGRQFGKEEGSLKVLLGRRCNDILRRIWLAQGFNPDVYQSGMGNSKLDDIAGATIGSNKIGNGADAPKWYQDGLIHKVINYCADDVAIERDLTDFVDRYGYVIHMGKQLFLRK